MAFDYKKEYKEFYLPPKTPGIVTVPAMNFLAVRGHGDPNKENGAYKQALGMLYAVAFTIKMSKLGKHRLEGYFDYVVPEFVTKEVFDWAIRETTEKKQQDFSKVEFFPWEEGLCVQCMHIGPYDDEPATVSAMAEYAKAQGYEADFGASRFHHEIYLSDVRRCKPERLKTVIRHPIRRVERFHRHLDGADDVEQVSVERPAVLAPYHGRLGVDETFLLQAAHIFADRVFAHAQRFADGLVAGPALIGFSVLDAQQVAVDRDLRMTEPDVKHFVGNQKIVFAGIAFGPLLKLYFVHFAPPFFFISTKRTSL